MSDRKPPSSAPTAPGQSRPRTPPAQNPAAGDNPSNRNASNGVAKPPAPDDSQTQQIPRVSDAQAPRHAPAPAAPPAAPAPAKAAPKPRTPRQPKAAKPAAPAPAQPVAAAPATPATKAPEARSGVATAGAIAADAETPQARTAKGDSTSTTSRKATAPKAKETATAAAPSRKARLRLVRFDPWSVMKTAFALSIALAIVTVVAVTLVWAVLDIAGVWDAINSSVATILSDNSDAFDVTDYVGFGRIIGFTILIAAIDVVLITAIATIGAFLYNLAASLLGGLEITLAEDN